MNIPNNVVKILNVLNQNGYEGYIVGGAVRDYLSGKEPHDYDIATNALPSETKALFEKTIDTGIKHGTVVALFNGEGYEITTYRVDGNYSDGRHPDSVSFVDDITKDLARRDFTINAMAMDIQGNIIDPFNGQEDLKYGIIRAVGTAEERFREDALRMLRAIRFAAQFNFTIDDITSKAIKDNANLLSNVSKERIISEYSKILDCENPGYAIKDALKLDVLKNTIIEIYRCVYSYVLINNTYKFDVLNNKPDLNKNVKWAIFFNCLDSSYMNNIDEILHKYKFSNKDINEISNILLNKGITLKYNDLAAIREFVATYGIDCAKNIYQLQDAILQNEEYFTHDINYLQNKSIYKTEAFLKAAEMCYKDGTAIKLSDLEINGNDLKDIGFKGKDIGEALDYLYHECLEAPTLNKKDMLIQMANDIFEKEQADAFDMVAVPEL